MEDLEFADDLAPLSHSVNNMQVKTEDLEASAAFEGLGINKDNTKIMKVKTDSSQAVTLVNGSIDEVQKFTYLGSVVDVTKGTEQDVKARLEKLGPLSRLWTSYGNQR